MTAAQRLDSLVTEMGALDILLNTQASNARFSLIYDNRAELQDAIREIGVLSRRIGSLVVDMLDLVPATVGAPLQPITQPSPALTIAPASAGVDADTPAVPGRLAGSRGGICAECGEYAAHLVPSIWGRWDYCRACADREIAEEAPATPDEDGNSCEYLYPDPDEQLDELRDRRMEAQG
jgi:hypothetical protein